MHLDIDRRNSLSLDVWAGQLSPFTSSAVTNTGAATGAVGDYIAKVQTRHLRSTSQVIYVQPTMKASCDLSTAARCKRCCGLRERKSMRAGDVPPQSALACEPSRAAAALLAQSSASASVRRDWGGSTRQAEAHEIKTWERTPG